MEFKSYFALLIKLLVIFLISLFKIHFYFTYY